MKEYVSTENERFVRLYVDRGDGRPNIIGSWLMREDAIRGLSTSQIKSKYALPNKPTHIVDVEIEVGAPMREGTVNPVFGGQEALNNISFWS